MFVGITVRHMATKAQTTASKSPRKRIAGHTLINVFAMPNHLHDMVTDKQKEHRNKGEKKLNIGQCINELLSELQYLRKVKSKKQS